MATRVKIIGAGSIGNHLANASRVLGWAVDLCDLDDKALARTEHEIYPARYGAWDDGIRLFQADRAPRGGYDYVFIGTPPDSHIALARAAVEEQPKAVLVEKPVCAPDLEGAQDLFEAAAARGVAVFSGYDHVVGEASRALTDHLATGSIGPAVTLDVEFREHWGGIFAAHAWLDGPADSYLGYWRRGGGASSEHSHAINLWQHFAHALDAGRIIAVSAAMDYVTPGLCDYDRLCLLNLRTDAGLTGRVVQDVVTNPPRKWARVQGENGYVEWRCGAEPGLDLVHAKAGDGDLIETRINKTRPDDFIQELSHLEAALQGDPTASPISLERGLDTMLVIAAAHKSVAEKRSVTIDYSKGYRNAALI